MSEKTQERLDLEARAEAIGLEFPHNLGDKKLAERVEKAEAAANASTEAPKNTPPAPPATEGTTGEVQSGTSPDAGGAAQDNPQPAKAGDAADQSEAPPAEGAVWRITGPKKGRWRVGRFFTKEPEDISIDDLSEDDLKALEADPRLTVELIEPDDD